MIMETPLKFWKTNMEIMVLKSMSSSNIDFILKKFCNVFSIVQMWDVSKKKIATDIAVNGNIFPHAYLDWPSWKSNVEAMVTYYL